MISRLLLCQRCGRCPAPNGECEEKVSRGRRFFLLGALALPVAAKLERVAALVAHVEPPPILASGYLSNMEKLGRASGVSLNPSVIAAIQDRILHQTFRDALFPKLLFRMEEESALFKVS